MEYAQKVALWNLIQNEVCEARGLIGSPWPRIIINTATEDIKRYRDRTRIQREKREAKAEGLPSHALGSPPATAFLPGHLRGATCEIDVLRKAVAGRLVGVGNKKPKSTRDIYERTIALEAALEMMVRFRRESGESC